MMNEFDIAKLGAGASPIDPTRALKKGPDGQEALQQFQEVLLENFAKEWLGSAFENTKTAQGGFATQIFTDHMSKVVAKELGKSIDFTHQLGKGSFKGAAQVYAATDAASAPSQDEKE